jgi:hypothetical protein
MGCSRVRIVAAFCIASFAAAPAAWAQWAVVDAPAIVQLIQEVQTTAQQLQTAKEQLLQAQQALQTMTGDRGMEQLLSGTVRNYLPSDWTQVTAAMHGSAGFGALSADVQTLVSANAVLSAQRLATLPPGAQQIIQDSRQWNAMQQALSHQALSNASSRFASWICRPGSEPSSACCKMSKTSCRFSTSRLKLRSHRCANRLGNRQSTGRAGLLRGFSPFLEQRWNFSQPFGRG